MPKIVSNRKSKQGIHVTTEVKYSPAALLKYTLVIAQVERRILNEEGCFSLCVVTDLLGSRLPFSTTFVLQWLTYAAVIFADLNYKLLCACDNP